MPDNEHLDRQSQSLDAASERDAVEDLLVELRAAEAGGVFRETQVDASVPMPVLRRLGPKVWIGAAAGLMLVATSWSLLWSVELSSLRDRSRTGLAGVDAPPVRRVVGSEALGCVGGPGSILPEGCRPHDTDSDGDFDLADFRAVQLAAVSVGG